MQSRLTSASRPMASTAVTREVLREARLGQNDARGLEAQCLPVRLLRFSRGLCGERDENGNRGAAACPRRWNSCRGPPQRARFGDAVASAPRQLGTPCHLGFYIPETASGSAARALAAVERALFAAPSRGRLPLNARRRR